MKIDAVGLFVNDMECTVVFYRGVVELKTNWNGDADVAFEVGCCCLIIFRRKDFESITAQTYRYPKGRNGTMEIAFALPSYGAVDAEYKRLVSLGVEAVFPPATTPWGQRTSYVADPEGNLLEIGSFGAVAMASDWEFAEYVVGQIAADAVITHRKVFGEYMLYANGKPAALICDNTVYIKTLDCVKPYLQNAERGFPYRNAKEHIIDPNDRELLSAVVKELERNVLLPKPKRTV